MAEIGVRTASARSAPGFDGCGVALYVGYDCCPAGVRIRRTVAARGREVGHPDDSTRASAGLHPWQSVWLAAPGGCCVSTVYQHVSRDGPEGREINADGRDCAVPLARGRRAWTACH